MANSSMLYILAVVGGTYFRPVGRFRIDRAVSAAGHENNLLTIADCR